MQTREELQNTVRTLNELGAKLKVVEFSYGGWHQSDFLKVTVNGVELLIGNYMPDSYNNIVDLNSQLNIVETNDQTFWEATETALNLPSGSGRKVFDHLELLCDMFLRALAERSVETGYNNELTEELSR